MSDSRMAVLIDADNSSASTIEAILRQVATFGKPNVRRAYGNWSKSELKGWTERLHEFAIAPVQQFDLVKGKNASDIAMVIDAMDLLHAGDVDGFAIVSSDADFTPLVMRLRQSGADVIGFGQAKAPEPFRNACTRYFEVEALVQVASDDDGPDKSSSKRRTGLQLKQDRKLMAQLRSAIDEAADDDGWATLSQVSNLIRNQSSFEQKNFGYAKFSDLVRAIDVFEVSTDNKRVRRKPAQQPAGRAAKS
jgi:uncharacterized protein (TIGR00288 family)